MEAEIANEMTILPLDVEQIRDAEPRLKEEDVDGLDKRDRKMVFHAAKLEQQQEAVIDILVTMNGQLRRMEANYIRERICTAAREAAARRTTEVLETRVNDLTKQSKTMKRVLGVAGTGVILEFLHIVFVKLFGK